jgi:hypothetical protein
MTLCFFYTLSRSLSLSLSNYNPVFVEHLSVAFDSLFFQPDLSTFLSFGTNLQPPFKTPFQNCMPCVCESVSVTFKTSNKLVAFDIDFIFQVCSVLTLLVFGSKFIPLETKIASEKLYFSFFSSSCC